MSFFSINNLTVMIMSSLYDRDQPFCPYLTSVSNIPENMYMVLNQPLNEDMIYILMMVSWFIPPDHELHEDDP